MWKCLLKWLSHEKLFQLPGEKKKPSHDVMHAYEASISGRILADVAHLEIPELFRQYGKTGRKKNWLFFYFSNCVLVSWPLYVWWDSGFGLALKDIGKSKGLGLNFKGKILQNICYLTLTLNRVLYTNSGPYTNLNTISKHNPYPYCIPNSCPHSSSNPNPYHNRATCSRNSWYNPTLSPCSIKTIK